MSPAVVSFTFLASNISSKVNVCVYSLFLNAGNSSDYRTSKGRAINEQMKMNWKECGRKQSWSILRHYARICLGD
jgi:hypothetical protein